MRTHNVPKNLCVSVFFTVCINIVGPDYSTFFPCKATVLRYDAPYSSVYQYEYNF